MIRSLIAAIANQDARAVAAHAAATGLAAGAALIIVVVSSGQTFGQRCSAAGHTSGSAAHKACVSNLSGR